METMPKMSTTVVRAYTVIGCQVQRNLCEIKVEPQLIEISIAVLFCCLHFNIFNFFNLFVTVILKIYHFKMCSGN